MVTFESKPGLKPEQRHQQADVSSSVAVSKRRQRCPAFGSISSALQPEPRAVPVFTLAKATQDAGTKERGYRILKIQGDGRCMFRALAQGLSRNKGVFISGETETKEADELRLAVRDALCRSQKRTEEFKDAVFSLEATEGPIGRYCQRLTSTSFWGGEVELLVLSKMLHTPIYVYKTAQEGGSSAHPLQADVTFVQCSNDGGLVPIQRYGEEYSRPSKDIRAPRRPVRLLYFEGNHYNLLL